MNKNVLLTITGNQELVAGVYEMTLSGDTTAMTEPGQFINIKLNRFADPYLRRPMSVCDYDERGLKIIYRVVGRGTRIMSQLKTGDQLDTLIGLGNGFLYQEEKKAVVIGGGLGVPPLFKLVKSLLARHVEVTAILGFNKATEVFYEDEFKALCPTYIATMDGSRGIKGTVLDALKAYGIDYQHYYACGPLPMLKALTRFDSQHGSLSYEARMGCGFGACMGCSLELKDGTSKRVCLEGPVFAASEVKIND